MAIDQTISPRLLKITRVYNRKGKTNEAGKRTIPNKDGKAPVTIVILKDRKRKYFDTGVRLVPYEWNEVKREPSSKDINRNSNLQKIQQIEAMLRAKESKFMAEGRTYTVWDFDLTERKEYTDLVQFWIDEQAKETTLSPATIKAHNTARSVLIEFLNNKPLHFSNLTRKFLDDYNQYLLGKGYNKNTIKGKHFKHLKKYTLRAIRHRLLKSEDNPFYGFKLPSEPVYRPFLTASEINKIEKLKFKKDESNLQAVRDFFLFQCYTGLRYSDVRQITEKNIIEDSEKKLSLIIDKSDKTDKTINLSLHLMFPVSGQRSKPEQILQRNRKDKQFPTFANRTEQHINRKLKDIATRAKIDKNLTTHIGRHSFITRMIYLVPLPTIQKLVQHSDIKTTMKYVHISTKEIDENLMRVKDWGV